MTTSGTYTFDPSLGELTIYAFNQIGIRPTSLVQEHLTSARMATNMMLSRWSNQGVNLWAVDLWTDTLIQGQASYTVDPSTVMILDAYVTQTTGTSQPTDRLIMPISRTEYASYPNKTQQGFTTTFWFDRLLNPTVTLWPVPDGTSAQYLKYYRVRQLQDANLSNAQTLDIPYLWLEAFADNLAYRLARIWAPEKAPLWKPIADESYQVAATQNVENAPTYVSPMISGYFRP